MKKRLLPLLLSTALILPLLCPAAAAEETATRRDLADALYALANRPSVSQTQLYSDLTEADDALHWISSEGYMVGYGSHTMAPDQAITRNQLATVLYEYAKEHNLALTKRAPIPPNGRMTPSPGPLPTVFWMGSIGTRPSPLPSLTGPSATSPR